MLSVEEYRDRILSGIAPLTRAEVPLLDALGLVLAEDVHTPRPMPSFDNSSMDGYAVHSADFSGGAPVTLRVIDDLPAGATKRPDVPRGCAARIMTGAPMPLGADSVVPVERTNAGTDTVEIDASPTPGDCIRRAGEDLEAGALAVAAGTIVTSRSIGLLAACDRATVPVIRRARVSIITTGDELVTPGSAVQFAQIVDSNNSLLAAAVRECGADVQRFGPVIDNAEEFTRALEAAAASSDLILTSGGVSMGAYDTVKEVLTARGGVVFTKVAMQPGMPQGNGSVDGTPIITLPGNPVSSFVSFQVYVRPALRRMHGFADVLPAMRTARVTSGFSSPASKTQFARGVLSGTDELSVAPVGDQGSHIIGGLALSNCLIAVPVGVSSVVAGDAVEVIDLR